MGRKRESSTRTASILPCIWRSLRRAKTEDYRGTGPQHLLRGLDANEAGNPGGVSAPIPQTTTQCIPADSYSPCIDLKYFGYSQDSANRSGLPGTGEDIFMAKSARSSTIDTSGSISPGSVQGDRPFVQQHQTLPISAN